MLNNIWEVLALMASYIGLLIIIIRIGINAIKGRTAQDLKIIQMEKDILEMDKRHALDILRIETSVETIRLENSRQHGLLFQKLETVGNDTSEIKGYLKASGLFKAH